MEDGDAERRPVASRPTRFGGLVRQASASFGRGGSGGSSSKGKPSPPEKSNLKSNIVSAGKRLAVSGLTSSLSSQDGEERTGPLYELGSRMKAALTSRRSKGGSTAAELQTNRRLSRRTRNSGGNIRRLSLSTEHLPQAQAKAGEDAVKPSSSGPMGYLQLRSALSTQLSESSGSAADNLLITSKLLEATRKDNFCDVQIAGNDGVVKAPSFLLACHSAVYEEIFYPKDGADASHPFLSQSDRRRVRVDFASRSAIEAVVHFCATLELPTELESQESNETGIRTLCQLNLFGYLFKMASLSNAADRAARRMMNKSPHLSSLQRQTGLPRNQYNQLLESLGLIYKKSGKYQVEGDEWKSFIPCGEYIPANPFKRIVTGGNRHYIRLGPKQDGYHTSPASQYKGAAPDDDISPPRINGIEGIQNSLREALQSIEAEEDNSSEDSSYYVSTSDESDEMLSEDEEEEEEQEDSGIEVGPNAKDSYPMLASLGISSGSLSDSKVEALVGDLVRLQLARSANPPPSTPARSEAPASETPTPPVQEMETPVSAAQRLPPKQKKAPWKAKRRVAFRFRRGNETYGAVPIPRHKSDKAFLRYHRDNPYVHELVHEMGKGKSAESQESDYSQGAKRILGVLAEAAPQEYADVAKEAGLRVDGIMDAVGLAAMKMDCQLKDWQTIRMFRHLRYAHRGAKLAVPLTHAHAKVFREGYVEPRTKKFRHRYPDKKFEWVEVEYQPIDEAYVKVLEELLAEHDVAPEDIEELSFILGGDHGIGRFRLCFRVVVALKSGKLLYTDYGGVASVTGKDTPCCLEAAIMDWLTEDLKSIASKAVHIEKLEDGTHGCVLVDKEDDAAGTVIPDVTIYNTGDLKWMATLLGMDGMSGEWCIFCMLRKLQWLANDHEKGEARTIERNNDLADADLEGTDRMGVKSKPYWDFIPIENYAIPLLHIAIGVFNDIISYFQRIVDSEIIELQPEETAEHQCHATTAQSLTEHRASANAYKSTPNFRKRSALLARHNKCQKEIEAGQTLTVNPLTPEEVGELQRLENLWNAAKKPRDDAHAKLGKSKTKIDAYCLARKEDPDSTHNQIEDCWKFRGLDRGKAHGGQFNGTDARKVMGDPREFFGDGMREILTKAKRPTVTEDRINELCDNVIHLMELWDKFFSLTQSETVTEEERQSVREVADAAVKYHFTLLENKTPKVHVVEDHAADHFLRLRPGMMRMCIEQFVERNHQESSQIEQNFRHVPSLVSRAKFTAAERHASKHAAVRKRNATVHKATGKGKYKTKRRTKPRTYKRLEGVEGVIPGVTPSPPSRQTNGGLDPESRPDPVDPALNPLPPNTGNAPPAT